MFNLESYIKKQLIKLKVATEVQLDELEKEVDQESSFVSSLEERKIADPDLLCELLSDFYHVASVNLLRYQIDLTALEFLSFEEAKRFQVIPLFRVRNVLVIGMLDPQDVSIIDEIRIQTGLGIEPIIVLPGALISTLDRVYHMNNPMSGAVETITDALEVDALKKTTKKEKKEPTLQQTGKSDVEDEPIVKLVNLFINQAVKQGASDMHFNPEEKELRVRFRIDGVLHEVATPPKKFEPAIISRIKVLADLDIAEKRKPQDGRIKINVDEKKIDIRVSTFPTIFGENIVMRILDTSNLMLNLKDIGFLDKDLNEFRKSIYKPYGIILVTGPTGSGKTTTLYSALSTINSVDKNIITLEDPVEYNLKLIRQGQVNTKAGFTFASGLRSILRQDPDVVMVGEIRDGETAHIAVEAALTGHLVLSTIHTNDSVSTIIRLADMGIERFLIASSLICIIAQRLLRRICESCKEPYHPPKSSVEELGLEYHPDLTFFRGKGCQRCMSTGYRGRIGVYEVLTFTTPLREAILRGDDVEQLKKKAHENGLRFLREDGIEKVKLGWTSIEEVLRVTKEG